MPNDRERAKRLGEKLDQANITIMTLEAALKTTEDGLAALKLAAQATKLKTDERHQEVLDKLTTLTQAFALHMNANTDAINSLTAKLDKRGINGPHS
jgi:Zn-dependent M16 (insulinase) family peptidase